MLYIGSLTLELVLVFLFVFVFVFDSGCPYKPSTLTMKPGITRAVLSIEPYPKSQASVWQIYSHLQNKMSSFNSTTGNHLRLIDFKVPWNTYYGVSTYLNRIDLTFRTDSEVEKSSVLKFLQQDFSIPTVFDIRRNDKLVPRKMELAKTFNDEQGKQQK